MCVCVRPTTVAFVIIAAHFWTHRLPVSIRRYQVERNRALDEDGIVGTQIVSSLHTKKHTEPGSGLCEANICMI